jgi:predicted ArsR family transcriptional regulator
MGKPGPDPETVPEEILAVFQGREDPNEPLTVSEIAEAVNCSRRTALDRLHELEECGYLTSKKVGAWSRVWWLSDDNRPSLKIPANDPLFTGEPLLTPDEPVDETEIDDVLYRQSRPSASGLDPEEEGRKLR